jgi:hypothetical protein
MAPSSATQQMFFNRLLRLWVILDQVQENAVPVVWDLALCISSEVFTEIPRQKEFNDTHIQGSQNGNVKIMV